MKAGSLPIKLTLKQMLGPALIRATRGGRSLTTVAQGYKGPQKFRNIDCLADSVVAVICFR
jgi:hypothetical protein